MNIEAHPIPGAPAYTIRLSAGEALRIAQRAIIGSTVPLKSGLLPAGPGQLEEVLASEDMEICLGCAGYTDAAVLDVGTGIRCRGSAVIAVEHGVARVGGAPSDPWWQLAGRGEVLLGAPGPMIERQIGAGETFYLLDQHLIAERGAQAPPDSATNDGFTLNGLFKRLGALTQLRRRMLEVSGPSSVYFSGRAYGLPPASTPLSVTTGA